jgi:uncharacterized protein YbbC (DUF1343 family)
MGEPELVKKKFFRICLTAQLFQDYPLTMRKESSGGFQNGVDRLLKEDFGLAGRRLGLITAPTGLSLDLVPTIDILKEHYDLRALFAPEHGVRGDMEAGGAVETYRDPRTGIPVHSMYAEGGYASPALTEDIDALLIDIQDLGCRFYTFISTMYRAMEDCARAGKTFVVLDRFNPINGVDVEGNIPDTRFLSFVGIAPIPQRHGMTMGELALFFNKECGIGCDLKIVPLRGWERSQFGDDISRIWVNPSPNIPSLDTALVYPGTCLFEGSNVSEGRGTTRPFEMIGAPWLDAEALAEELNAAELPGVVFRPVYFRPYASKHQGKLCRGVQIHVRDRRIFRPVNTGIAMLDRICRISGTDFEWLRPQRENDPCFIDLLAGTDLPRGGRMAQYRESCETGGIRFSDARKPYLLY